LDWKRQRPIKFPKDALSPVHAEAFGVIDSFFSGNSDGVFFGLDLKFLLIKTRQFNDGQDVVTLLKHVDRRERAATSGLVMQPAAGDAGFKLPLQIEQRVERIGKSGDHVRTHVCLLSGATKMTIWSPVAPSRHST
jgi:hypothetical protein